MYSKEFLAMVDAMCVAVKKQIGKATSAEELEALAKVASIVLDIVRFLGVSQ